MTGLLIAAVGYVTCAAALVVVVGVWTLIPAGGVLVPAGLFVDWERLHGKRH